MSILLSTEVPVYPAKEYLFCPTISVFVTFLQLLSSVVLNAIFNIDPLDEVAPVLWIEPPTFRLQGRICSCWATQMLSLELWLDLRCQLSKQASTDYA